MMIMILVFKGSFLLFCGSSHGFPGHSEALLSTIVVALKFKVEITFLLKIKVKY